jgi:hypothetical protein
VLKHIPIGEANHAVSFLVQPSCALLIVRPLVRVGIPIDLHNKSTSSTVEIYDESADGMLTAKLEASELPVAQTGPQLLFSRGLLAA